ncbi:hypothetical protein DCAR_0311453 [Daucus carota subsp. sativus]|uniref:Senescence domain-containing protein n=1 Tax=Daucus carota subsp. sativus TaxID=79200 RepID=A0AAF0WPN0_DAUCS|nr:hypothetical protein DCAR_0311453 [Daucus carota subsp. sativus]
MASQSREEILISVPCAILHLIDNNYSVQLASGDFSIVCLCQGNHVVAVIAKVSDKIQWPLMKDEASVKLDELHYFFSFRAPGENEGETNDLFLSYGLTFTSGGQESLSQLDQVLEKYTSFSVQTVTEEVADGKAGYWTVLAPNVEDYSSSAAKLITEGSGHLIKGILWCGDVAVDRVKRVTEMTEKVAFGILSGTVTVSGIFTSSIASSKLGRRLFGLLPGQIVLASLDGFNKICDAIEVAGSNVMSTSSTVTTGLVSQKYGEEASKVSSEVLDAAGHAIRTAWAVFKIKNSLNPKSVMKPSRIIKKSKL